MEEAEERGNSLRIPCPGRCSMKTKTYPRPTIHVSFGGTGLHGRNSGYAGYIRLSKRALSSTVSQSDAILNPPKRLVPLSDAFLAQSVSMNLLDCGWKTGLRCIFCTGTGACQARRFPFWHAVGGCGFTDEARLRQNWRRSARSAPPPASRTARPRHRTGRRLLGSPPLGRREPGEPTDEQIRNVEGWILGQRAP